MTPAAHTPPNQSSQVLVTAQTPSKSPTLEMTTPKPPQPHQPPLSPQVLEQLSPRLPDRAGFSMTGSPGGRWSTGHPLPHVSVDPSHRWAYSESYSESREGVRTWTSTWTCTPVETPEEEEDQEMSTGTTEEYELGPQPEFSID